jgi:hypothetical protein
MQQNADTMIRALVKNKTGSISSYSPNLL